MTGHHPTDALIASLLALFKRSEDTLTQRLIEAVTAGKSANYVAARLVAVSIVLDDLRQQKTRWVDEGGVAKAASLAADATTKELARQGVSVEATPLLPKDAIAITAQNMTASLDDALRHAGGQVQGWGRVAYALAGAGSDGYVPYIGRRVQDELRRIGLDATARKLAEGMTVRDMRKALAADLIDNGITVMRDQTGRRWSLNSYAGMVARTTTREAYTQGTIATMQQYGQDLLQASEHWPTCPICAARQGRVYSISGTDPEFPALSTVGPTPWHPHCRHTLSPKIREYTKPDELERLEELSNRTFDGDHRTKAETEAYDTSQRINALRRERQELLAVRKADAVPLDKTMTRWTSEMGGASPERRRELETRIADRMDRWEEGRRDRLKEVNAELKRLAAQQRQSFRNR